MSIQARIAALEEALAQGAKRVIFHSGGTRREVEYHSLSDMREELARLKDELLGGRGRRTYARYRDGH